MIIEAIEKAGYKPGSDVALALDVASTEFFKDGAYQFEGAAKTTDEMVKYYEELVSKYPLVSIEDPLSEMIATRKQARRLTRRRRAQRR